MIEKHIGGVVLAAKSDEREQWLKYFRQAGVEDPIGTQRLRVIDPEDKKCRFDPLAYEYLLAPEGGTRRLTSLFMTALGSGDGRVASDAYWDDALRELLGHAIDLVVFSNATVAEDGCLQYGQDPPGLDEIAAVIKTSAQSVTEAKSKVWRESGEACPAMLEVVDRLYDQLLAAPDHNRAVAADVCDTFVYWTRIFPNLADRTRSVILTSFTGKANDLLRRPLREIFCNGHSTDEYSVLPTDTHRGVVVLVNIPVKRYGEVGEFSQKLYKTVWQHATESDERDMDDADIKPTFLWADEAQHFVTKEDVLFQATARSKLAATIYLTQNISNYYCILGGDKSSATDALLGSLQMKVFHANGDPATNEWGERLFGQRDTPDPSSSYSTGQDQQLNYGGSLSMRTKPTRLSSEFTRLGRGDGTDGSTSALLFHAGKQWKGGGNSIAHQF
ncbi:hypothetical protein [Botrimarina mediterranea]|uniref:hypothetical protein n=1 Tax=Botrimarina mediterranea TaxID=2528022 RepID=UPI0011A6242A